MKKIIAYFILSVLSLNCFAAWPTKPVTLIIPFGPGSMATQVANSMQNEFEEKFKLPLIVKYMPGAGASVAVNHVLADQNDDHTIVWATDDFITSQFIQGTQLYNQFVPVNIVATHGTFVYSNSSTSIEQFKQQLKDKKVFNIGNMGVNGGYEIWTKQLKHPGMTVNPIPYKGAAAMQTDVLGGHLAYGISILTTARPLVDDGTIKVIMVSTLERNHAYKDVPTFRELGIQGEPYYGFYGFFTRKDTSGEAVEGMSRFLKDFVQNNSVIASQYNNGLTIANASGSKAQKIIADTIKRLQKTTK